MSLVNHHKNQFVELKQKMLTAIKTQSKLANILKRKVIFCSFNDHKAVEFIETKLKQYECLNTFIVPNQKN